MTPEETGALARRCVELLGSRQLTALFDLLHEDASWSIPFDKDSFPFAGTWGKEDMRAVLTSFQAHFDTFEIAVTKVVAQPGSAAVEAVGRGKGPGKARYKNVFHFAIECDNGRIHRIREYFNPIEVSAYVQQLGAASDALEQATAGN